MGQYYMPVIKRGNVLRRVYSHDFGNGLKLMEHSYIDNNFVNVVANELVENPAQLYWMGDYTEESDLFSPSMFKRLYGYAWQRSENDRTTVENPNEEFDWTKDWYYVNETKKEYMLMPKPGNWIINPISLLTATSNGRGGGDYHKDNEYVGYWMGDRVYLSLEKPNDKYTDMTCYIDFGRDEW